MSNMLNYLNFDYAEDAEGVGTFEAVASTWPEQVSAVQREIALVLDWAYQAFAGQLGPVGEGGEWDYDLHGLREFTAPETMAYNPATRQFAVQAAAPGKPRHTVTLTLSGTDGFCAAFRREFGLA
ncbi:MAG: hypothetical protein M3R45_08750 [Pseudomonadota bacterium]|nr:hypothetical protein [Pseudomonadota bacterium]